ncbi:hypothetical protein [Sphingomonas sp. CCH10-B3]|uniref:hypothetical protein n=1 Tax=Sphingomonas sp. CCH10-B3 TaxID=1768757 RepID=UPI001E4AC41C|nr:hypothetical protein [Sphingomonas sp. CCH10-B3]
MIASAAAVAATHPAPDPMPAILEQCTQLSKLPVQFCDETALREGMEQEIFRAVHIVDPERQLPLLGNPKTRAQINDRKAVEALKSVGDRIAVVDRAERPAGATERGGERSGVIGASDNNDGRLARRQLQQTQGPGGARKGSRCSLAVRLEPRSRNRKQGSG